MMLTAEAGVSSSLRDVDATRLKNSRGRKERKYNSHQDDVSFRVSLNLFLLVFVANGALVSNENDELGTETY